jgi:hypothetical protein
MHKIWFYMLNPSYSDFNNEIKEYPHKLNRLGFGNLKPLIMCSMVKFSENDFEEEKMLEFLKLAEKFVFLVFKVTGRQGSTEKNNFYKYSHDLFCSEKRIDRAKIIDEIIEHLNWLLSPENLWNGCDLERFYKDIRDQFNKGNGYYGWRGLRYFLYEYELDLQKNSKESAPKITWEYLHKNDTIEHIYPQNPKDNCWSVNYDRFSSEEKELLLNSLGNLLLLSRSKNLDEKNYCFDYKKKHTDKKGSSVGYFIGSYSEIMVSQYESWYPNNILERGIELLEFMERRWNIKIPNKERFLFLDSLNI